MKKIRLDSEGNEDSYEMSPYELPSGCPRKSSSVIMWMIVGGVQRKQRVVLRLYKSYFDCYAVVSQDKVLCKDCGYINLKNSICTLFKGQLNTFQITPNNKEGQSLKFTVQSSSDLSSWMEELNEFSGQSKKEAGNGCITNSRSRMHTPISPRLRQSPTKTPMLPALNELGEE